MFNATLFFQQLNEIVASIEKNFQTFFDKNKRIILLKCNKRIFMIIFIEQKIRSNVNENKLIGMSDKKYPIITF